MKTILYVIKATNTRLGPSCLIDAYFDKLSAMNASEFCNSWKTTTAESYLVSMRGIDSYVSQIHALNQNQTQWIRKVAQFFTHGPYAGCRGMNDISIVEKEFDSYFEALAAMAAIKAEANSRNLKIMEEIDEAGI